MITGKIYCLYAAIHKNIHDRCFPMLVIHKVRILEGNVLSPPVCVRPEHPMGSQVVQNLMAIIQEMWRQAFLLWEWPQPGCYLLFLGMLDTNIDYLPHEMRVKGSQYFL